MVDHEDWGVTNNFFEFIDNLWEPHSVDRFASVLILHVFLKNERPVRS
jgi:hypothetical protein